MNGAHDGHAAAAGHGIRAERDAGGARRGHPLNQYRGRARQHRQSVPAAVRENPLGETRAPDETDAIGHVGWRDVQVALELSGERMLGAVFVARGRAHRHQFAIRTQRAHGRLERLPNRFRDCDGVDRSCERSAIIRLLERRPLLGCQAVVERRRGQDERGGDGQSGALRPRERTRLAAGVGGAGGVADVENPRHHLAARQTRYASGIAPSPRYINTVHTPAISSIDLPPPEAVARTKRSATPIQIETRMARRTSIAR